ncbi:MAG: alpha/beta hydrolase [Rubellimicrobium sp.]|nr:alpha/beta hydrolase [Rubellimicrobium sp.]
MAWVLGLLGLVGLVLVAIPVVLRLGLRLPDRALATGQFAELSQGVTHYRWIGPVRGPVVVAIHGLTTPSAVFEAVAEGLGQTGYRVLVYDLYGRGQSETVRGAQDRDFFLTQLLDLLENEGLREDLTLLGYSMGGAIATAFAARFPERMKRLMLVAPSGIEVVEDDFERWTKKVPVLGDWLHAVLARGRMTARLIAARGDPTEVPGIVDAQLAELQRPGFLTAVLASRRGMLAEALEGEHRAIARDDIPVIAIWGEVDDVVPLRALGTLATWNRTAKQEVVARAGHGLVHTHASAVVALLREVLREA